jgi:hypothetical protein
MTTTQGLKNMIGIRVYTALGKRLPGHGAKNSGNNQATDTTLVSIGLPDDIVAEFSDRKSSLPSTVDYFQFSGTHMGKATLQGGGDNISRLSYQFEVDRRNPDSVESNLAYIASNTVPLMKFNSR